MIFHDVQQNTDEWLDLRAGKLTGSTCSKMMANFGKAFGEPAKKAAVTIAVEQVTGRRCTNDSFSNGQMIRGHAQEPLARMMYEDQHFVDVTNGGFFDCGQCGCSPDGLVVDDGLIEIKSVVASVHYNNIKRGGIDPAYQWQFYFNLLKTGRDWIDFVSYCADFPEETKLYVHRVNRDECSEQFDKIEERSEQFFRLVEEIKRSVI